MLDRTTQYTNQIYNVKLDTGAGLPQLSIDFTRSITVQIGADAAVTATYDGIAGAP